jgi:hypothetical protein
MTGWRIGYAGGLVLVSRVSFQIRESRGKGILGKLKTVIPAKAEIQAAVQPDGELAWRP